MSKTSISDSGVQVEAERAKFEAWARDKHWRVERWGDRYASQPTQDGWYAWRARADRDSSAGRAALPVAPGNERIDAGWGKLSEPKIRTLMQIAHKWAGPDEDDCRSDDLEMALREARVPTQTRPAAPVAALSDAEILEIAGQSLVTGENQLRSDGHYYYRSLGTTTNVRDADLIAFARALLRHPEGKE